MILSYSYGPINKKSMLMYNYINTHFFKFQKGEFIVSNNNLKIMFWNLENTKLNFIHIRLSKDVNLLTISKFSGWHVEDQTETNTQLFNFANFEEMKKIIKANF